MNNLKMNGLLNINKSQKSNLIFLIVRNNKIVKEESIFRYLDSYFLLIISLD